MAEILTVVTPVIDMLVQLINEANLFKGLHRELKSLKDELESIEGFLKDAEEKSNTGYTSDGVKTWVKQVREEAYHIEDVIDRYLLHVAQHCQRRGFIGLLQKTSYWFKALKAHHHITFEIKNIKTSLGEIKDRGERYGFNSLVEGSSSKGTITSIKIHDLRSRSLFVEDEEFLDANFTRNDLITRLVEGPSTRMVISFVGTGGIGKTSLVKNVYEFEVVKGHFDCCAWITVSQSYNLERLLKIMRQQICSYIQCVAGEVDVIEHLIYLLRQYLLTKRYLVVFDDVWQTDFWCLMKHALPRNDKGSRIVVTSRNDTVAASCRETSCDLAIKLQPWSQELAWKLFCKKAFQFEFDGHCPEELEELSLKIVKKCEGLPLVIATVASLLSLKEKVAFEWIKMHAALCSELETNPHLSKISKVLSLSYHNLPYYLKSCLLYFGIFPEDRLIPDVRLYRHWIAEGFIKEKRSMTLEQVAKEYLNELIQRNLVQVWDMLGGSVKLCRVHDLIRDFILSRASELGFCHILDEKRSTTIQRSRRLSIYNGSKNVMDTVKDYGARSMFLFNINELTKDFMVKWLDNLKKFKLLKVLDLTDVPLEYLPKEVGSFFHLKSFRLRNTKVKELPKFIGNLTNLQTLDLLYSPIFELPVEINKLRNLQHLLGMYHDCTMGHNLGSFRGMTTQKGIGCLENLQILGIIDAHHRGRDLVKELEMLRQLRLLAISKLTVEIGRALCLSIQKMNHLEQLYLFSISADDILDLESISSPPLYLYRLGVTGPLKNLPNWISKLQNLARLGLSFSSVVDDPLKSLKGLPSLEYLWLEQAYEGEELHFEEGSFRKLKLLQLSKLDRLEVVKMNSGALPILEELYIGSCPLLKTTSGLQHLKSLKQVQISGMPSEFVLGLKADRG